DDPLDAKLVLEGAEVIAPELFLHGGFDRSALGEGGEEAIGIGTGIGGKAHVEVVALDQSLTSMRRRNIGAHQQMSAENGERDVHDVSLLFFRDRGSTLHRRDV